MLSDPTIVGGLSPLSKSVRLNNQFIGAVVTVLRNGAPIARRAATSFDEVFEFDPGVTLAPKDAIIAKQELDGDGSPGNSQPTLVQQLVPPHDGQRFASHVYACGKSLFLTGIVPGAEVRIATGAVPLGSATSVDGGAVVVLTSPTAANMQLEARQQIGGVAGPSVLSTPADPPPLLTSFQVEDAFACTPGITVHGVVDGAQVHVRTVADDPSTQRTFDVPVRDLFLPLPALTAHQKLLVQEGMQIPCHLVGSELRPEVAPMSFERLPVIDGPLCAGTKRIRVHALKTGVRVTAKQGATVVGEAMASADHIEMWVEPLLDNGQPLIVTESLCGASADSLSEPVVATPEQVPPCHIVEPLVECSMVLWLTGAHQGAIAAAFSDQRGQISEWMYLPSAQPQLPLYSPLQNGHTIRVELIACGGVPTESDNTPMVQPVPSLAPPTLEHPVFWDRPAVHVTGAQPGALVQLYAQEAGYISSAIANPRGEAALPRDGMAMIMRVGWHVWARQILCNQISSFKQPPEEVIERTPLKPVITAPSDGAVNVAQRPQLRWNDPGAGTFRQASSFLVRLTTPDHPLYDLFVVNEVVTDTSFTLGQDLAQNGKYIWEVRALVGDPGFEVSSQIAKANFTVQPPPTPPPPPPPPAFSNAFLYNCNTDHRAVHIWKRDATLGEAWQFVQIMGPQYDESGACPSGGAQPLKIPLTDGHFMQIVAVDPDNIGCVEIGGDPNKADPNTLACQRDLLTLLGKTNGPALNYSIS